MAFDGNLQIVPGLVAAGDLSGKQYRFGVIGASGVSPASVSGDPVDGVIQDDPDAANLSVSLAYSGVSKVVAGGVITKGDKVQANADGKATTAAAAATAATKACSAELYDLANGDTGVLDIDNAGNETFTFNATAATVEDTSVYTGGTAADITDNFAHGADQVGLTMTVTVTDAINGAVPTVVTIAAACTTAVALAAELAAVVPNVLVSVAGGHVVVTSNEVGLDVSITIVAGTSAVTWATPTAGTGGLANQEGLTAVVTLTGGEFSTDVQTVTFTAASGFVTRLSQIIEQLNAQVDGAAFSALGGQVLGTHDSKGSGMAIVIGAGTGGLTWDTPVAGSGDAVDASAVTALELEILIEGDTTAEVVVVAGVPTIVSPTTGINSELDFISGTLLAKLGLSVETINGAASGTYYAGKALEASAADGDIIPVLLQNGINV